MKTWRRRIENEMALMTKALNGKWRMAASGGVKGEMAKERKAKMANQPVAAWQ
jgi:hypothetical protein